MADLFFIVLLVEKVSQEWKDKYIDRIIFLAPSWGGAPKSLPVVWDKKYDSLPFIVKRELIVEFIESLTTYPQHFHNYEIFKGLPIIRDQFDKIYEASEVEDFFIKSNKIPEKNVNIFRKSLEMQEKAPTQVNVPCFIIFNSGIQTSFSFHFKKGLDKKPELGFIDGDGTLPYQGPRWPCDKWNLTNYSVHCLDLFQNHPSFGHSELGSNPYVVEFIFNLSTQDNWIREGGRKITQGPFLEMTSKNQNYKIRNDLRKETILFHENL